MLERYPVPGECGGRTDVRHLELKGGDAPRLRVEGDPLFQFSALPVSPDDLIAARHDWELVPRKAQKDQVGLVKWALHGGQQRDTEEDSNGT
jgi:hypothetical protein